MLLAFYMQDSLISAISAVTNKLSTIFGRVQLTKLICRFTVIFKSFFDKNFSMSLKFCN